MGNQRQQALLDALQSRILVLDGAMGTMVQQRHLTADDFGGAHLEGCNENLVLTRPDVILDIQRAYLAAGADIIETDTFGSTPLVLAEYGLAGPGATSSTSPRRDWRARPRTSISTPAKPRFVAGSIGPTTKAITVTGGVTFPELIETLLRSGQGAGRGRRRHPAGRDLPGHPQRQSGAARASTRLRARSGSGSR